MHLHFFYSFLLKEEEETFIVDINITALWNSFFSTSQFGVRMWGHLWYAVPGAEGSQGPYSRAKTGRFVVLMPKTLNLSAVQNQL